MEKLLESGEKVQGLFCEFPSNPLLKAPNLLRIRVLADKFHFAVVVDETIGNFINVNVLPYADVVVSSLTKVFSGASNVMGGWYDDTLTCSSIYTNSCSVILNTQSKFYHRFKEFMNDDYEEENYWAEDAILLEQNSRDFIPRIGKMNANAEAVCTLLQSHPKGMSFI